MISPLDRDKNEMKIAKMTKKSEKKYLKMSKVLEYQCFELKSINR